ncbi:MAG TPA: signal peptidase II [Rhizomicrobium sp.]|nr:signal peptidase II [Rhizomicrobium sp.]
MTIRLSPREWGLAAAAGALLADQATKLLVLYGLGFAARDDGYSLRVLPFFNLTMHRNPGISFGLLPVHGPFGYVLLVLIVLAVIGALGLWLWSSARRGLAVGLGLILGGALGNLIDRVIYGKVADFFDFHAMGYHWYVFNLADCAITLGLAALIYDAFFRPDSGPGANRQTGA